MVELTALNFTSDCHNYIAVTHNRNYCTTAYTVNSNVDARTK